MNIVDALEEANTAAKITTMAFANIKEFQSFMDSFNFSDYPVNVIVPFTSNGTNISGRRKSTIPLQGWVLTRVVDEPLDLRSLKAEREYIGPMRALAVKFITALLDTEIIDTDSGAESVSDSIRPEYAFLDAQVFGVGYTVNLNVAENTC